MSEKYSTGDLAKEAGVTVRTVQYYDKRGILSPSELSEGGRRVYSIADLEKLRQIIYLRDLDFSIDNIKNLFTEDNASQILELFLQVQIRELRLAIDSKKDKLDKAVNLLKTVEKQDSKTLGYLSDIVLMEENKRKWGKLQKKHSATSRYDYYGLYYVNNSSSFSKSKMAYVDSSNSILNSYEWYGLVF